MSKSLATNLIALALIAATALQRWVSGAQRAT